MTSLKKRALGGTLWTVVGYGISQALRLGSNLILTRLLMPEAFGIMALINTILIGLELFSDLGINISIIQNKRGEEPNFLNTAWTVQVLRGLGLWLICNLAAWPIAHFYEDSRLFWILIVISLAVLFQGFSSTSLAMFNRKIEIKQLVRFEISIQIITLTVTIVWAYLEKSIWALVGGAVISNFVKMIWSHRLNSETPNHFAWDREALKEIISLGKWIFVSTAFTFLATQADRLILSKLISFEMLGVYSIALTFAEIPKQIVGRISYNIFFPIISQQAHLSRVELREKILQQRWWLLMGSALLVLLLFSCGDLLVLNLYDKRYKDAAWMTPLLALGFWPFLLAQTSSLPLVALGKSFYPALGNCFKFLFIAIGIPLSFSQMGILGAIILIACNDFPIYGTIIYGQQQEHLNTVWQDVIATLVFGILLILAILVREMFHLGVPIAIKLT